MTMKPGSMYKVGGRRYVDSQAAYNLARAHEVVPHEDGWRVVLPNGSVRLDAIEGPPALPGQRGSLYAVTAQSDVVLKAERAAWLSRGLVRAAGTFDTWPNQPPTACGCGSTCGCGTCRHKHGHHDET